MNLSGTKTQLTLQVVSSLILIIGLLLNFSIPASAQTPAAGPSDPAELSAFLDGVMVTSMDSNHVPGSVVVVVKDGEVFFANGYGYADLETKTPVDPAVTLFRPGSVSKLFTWTAVMQLVEAGQLDLDTDVNTYLDFEIPATYTQPITLRHILIHMTGFEDKGDGLFKLDEAEVSSLETYLKTNLPARVFPPGQYGAYSNYASALSGYIVERISGMPFENYITSNIFEPLQMQQSTFKQPLPAELAGQMSKGYNYLNGEYIEGSFEFVAGTPAGALSATGLDMANFMIAHLQEGEFEGARILAPETVRLMHSPLYSPDPQMGGMAYGFFHNTINGQYTLSHGGDTMLFHSQLFLLPESNVGVYVSTNGTAGNVVAENLITAFIDRYYPAEERSPLTPTSDFSSRANQYTGTYYLARSNFTTFEKFISLMSGVDVRVKDERVYVSFGIETAPYVEVEPGFLVNPDDPSDKLVLKIIDNQISLSPPLPFVFLKMPWYRALPLHMFILIGGAILFLITLISWVISFFKGLKNREKRPLLARLSRISAGLFGVFFLNFILNFGSIFADTHPAFGVPRVFFGMPANSEQLFFIPILMAIFGLTTLVFTVINWIKRFWTVKSRLFYTLLSVFTLAIIWSFTFWNLL
ncbi:MAG: serine hydrolase domain-containing protein [Anaerolineaceae bacterium]|nr:serine hydrolase domain-containing protein [Anaerolineaceae bacterium]